MSTELSEALGETPEQETIVEPEQVEPTQEAVEVASEPAPKEEPHMVPLPVFMEMKNEVKALKDQIALQNQPKPEPSPDFLDPDGAQYREKNLGDQRLNERLKFAGSLYPSS